MRETSKLAPSAVQAVVEAMAATALKSQMLDGTLRAIVASPRRKLRVLARAASRPSARTRR
jgi:hypothetical protein